jgi:hypothetical protein
VNATTFASPVEPDVNAMRQMSSPAAIVHPTFIDRHALARHPGKIHRDDFRGSSIGECFRRIGENDIHAQTRRKHGTNRHRSGADMHQTQRKSRVKDVVFHLNGHHRFRCNAQANGAMADAVNESRKP